MVDKCNHCNKEVIIKVAGDSCWLAGEYAYHDKCWFEGAEANHRVNKYGKRTLIYRVIVKDETTDWEGYYNYNWNINKWVLAGEFTEDELGSPPNDNITEREREQKWGTNMFYGLV